MVVLLIVFVCLSKKVSGKISMAEMPLLPHNAPTVPNPESRHREPADVFVRDIVFRSNIIGGGTSTTEMPLFPHNAPTVPNPESRHREPGDVFIEEIVENYRDVHAVPVCTLTACWLYVCMYVCMYACRYEIALCVLLFLAFIYHFPAYCRAFWQLTPSTTTHLYSLPSMLIRSKLQGRLFSTLTMLQL